MELTKNIFQTRIIKSLLAIILGSIALTISAKIKIPFYPVPMTMQTFVVLFLGISLGYKIGLASVGLYLFEGILGLPVFSNSPEKGVGLVYFTGPTMGYLFGFLTASYLASKISSKDSFLLVLGKLIIATSTIYILGLLWLGTLIGWDKPIIELGAQPFLLAEIFKLVLLALVTKQILKISANKKGFAPNAKIGLSHPINVPSQIRPKIYIVEVAIINFNKTRKKLSSIFILEAK